MSGFEETSHYFTLAGNIELDNEKLFNVETLYPQVIDKVELNWENIEGI